MRFVPCSSAPVAASQVCFMCISSSVFPPQCRRTFFSSHCPGAPKDGKRPDTGVCFWQWWVILTSLCMWHRRIQDSLANIVHVGTANVGCPPARPRCGAAGEVADIVVQVGLWPQVRWAPFLVPVPCSNRAKSTARTSSLCTFSAVEKGIQLSCVTSTERKARRECFCEHLREDEETGRW